MRLALFVSLAVILMVGLVFVTRSAPAAPRVSKEPPKWDYKVVNEKDIEKLSKADNADWELAERSEHRYRDGLAKLGQQGWELVTIVKTNWEALHYFKRQK
jgi:hypothetical protein